MLSSLLRSKRKQRTEHSPFSSAYDDQRSEYFQQYEESATCSHSPSEGSSDANDSEYTPLLPIFSAAQLGKRLPSKLPFTKELQLIVISITHRFDTSLHLGPFNPFRYSFSCGYNPDMGPITVTPGLEFPSQTYSQLADPRAGENLEGYPLQSSGQLSPVSKRSTRESWKCLRFKDAGAIGRIIGDETPTRVFIQRTSKKEYESAFHVFGLTRLF